MGKGKEETGNIYGDWLVLFKEEELTKQKKRAIWVCECRTCKTKKNISGSDLRTRLPKCPNCKLKENQTSEINNRYGKMTVIDFSYINKDRHYIWKCKCDCGNIEDVSGTLLRNGTKICCNECNKENHLPQPNFIDETGNKYGLLTVLKRDPSKTKTAFWICQCDCGKIISVWGNHLRKKHTQSCGCTRMSHGEIKIFEILQKNNIPFVREYPAFNFEETNKPARFDFYVNNKYFIEFDGETHYETNLGGWHTKSQVENQQKKDQIKTQWCLNNNIPLIRIPYTEYNNLCLNDLLLETSNFIVKGVDE